MDQKNIHSMLDPVMKGGRTVLICAERSDVFADLTAVLEEMSCRVIYTDPSVTWKQLLRLAFSQRAAMLVGDADVLLGLAKLSAAAGTPLKIRNILLTHGDPSPWLMDTVATLFDCHVLDMTAFFENGKRDCDEDIAHMRDLLLQSPGVIDCRLQKGECGLTLDMITYPGLGLPILPNVACLNVRAWDPETDAPYSFEKYGKIPPFSAENH